jgi:hypothetical protein
VPWKISKSNILFGAASPVFVDSTAHLHHHLKGVSSGWVGRLMDKVGGGGESSVMHLI